jgi:hypothetical protein
VYVRWDWHKLSLVREKGIAIMNDFDAKNHLRDLYREAANERLARQVEEAAQPKTKKVVRPSLFTTSVKLLTGFAR